LAWPASAVAHRRAVAAIGACYRLSRREQFQLIADGSQRDARFAREVQLLSELSHPGIVRYIAHGVTPAGAPFLVMEWLDGEDLGHRLERAPLTIGESVALANPGCRGARRCPRPWHHPPRSCSTRRRG
jgi:serine/threonine protein kinase